MGELIKPKFDTAPDQQVSVSLDIGVVPLDYPGAGKYIVTIQAWPLPDRRAAETIADALVEAISARLGIKMKPQAS